MRLESDEVLRSFAGNARCELCGKYGPVVGHHYWIRRGCGGGTRIDHPWNLIGLCSTPGMCHDEIHRVSDLPLCKNKLLTIVADREGVSEKTIREYLAWLAQQDKGRSVGPQGSNR